MHRRILYAALCASVTAVSAAPAPAVAGVMPIAAKTSVAPASSVDQVDWRAYPHRHHRWHTGWYYGWPRYRYGMYAGWNPRFAPRRAIYGYAPRAVYGAAAPYGSYAAAAPGCGVYGAAAPAYDCCGTYGYGGGGLFGLGFGGGGLLGLGLGPL
jgi:hypothetical protein